MKLPKTLGACVDMIYKMRETRLAAQKIVDEQKHLEETLKNHILTNFNRQDVDKASGKLATCAVTRRTVGDIEDWDTFTDFIKKTNSFDLLQKRINDTAYRLRLDDSVEVPGVEAREVVSLSITKR
jgi:hypothetical protein